jgi:hypothetical protein
MKLEEIFFLIWGCFCVWIGWIGHSIICEKGAREDEDGAVW